MKQAVLHGKKEKVGYSIGFAILIAIGLLAILNPSLADDYTAVGPRAGLKQLVADYWGAKLGLGMMALGALALVGVHTTE